MEPESKQAKKPESDQETRLQEIYGTVPSRAQLLDHQLEGRTFFDSGDHALSKAKKPSSMGSVTTGSQHPCREAISHPFCPVPSLSNIDEISNTSLQDKEKEGGTRRKSSLHEITRGDLETEGG